MVTHTFSRVQLVLRSGARARSRTPNRFAPVRDGVINSLVHSVPLSFTPRDGMAVIETYKSECSSLLRIAARCVVRAGGRSLIALVLLLASAPAAMTQSAAGAEADPVKLFEQGQDAHERGDFAAALKFYEQALAAHAEFPEAEFQRGAALVSLKRNQQAAQAFRRAIELRPNWEPPRTALARLEKSVAPAEPDTLDSLRRATSRPDATADTWLHRARLELEAKDAVAAAASAEQAVKLDPQNLAARILLAGVFVDAEDAVRAVAELRSIDELLSVAAKDARTPEAARHVANLYARLGERARLADARASLAFYRRAAELAPENADYATGYAAALVQARRFDEAVAILNRIIKIAPDNYAAHANLAAALDASKHPAEALIEYRWLRSKRPELAITYFFIARSHDLLGQYAEALVEYEAFVGRADPAQHNLEVEKVKLRLPGLRNQAQKQKRR